MTTKTVMDVVEKIEAKTILWDDATLKTILRKDKTSDLKVLKHKEELIELAIYLNEGFIDVVLSDYEGVNGSWETLNIREMSQDVEEESVLEKVIETTPYIDVAYMKFHAWKWLQSKKNQKIEMKKNNICWYSADLQAMTGVGDINPKHLMDSLRKGIAEYAVLPFTRNEKRMPIIVFKPNQKFQELLLEKEKEAKEIEKFFHLKKNKKMIFPNEGVEVDQHTTYEEGDLVEFIHKNDKKRGIILMPLLNKKDFLKAKKVYHREKNDYLLSINQNEYVEIERELGLKTKKVTFKWFGEESIVSSSVLIKCPVNRKNGLTFEFYTISLKDICTKTSIDIDSIGPMVRGMWDNSGIKNLTITICHGEKGGINAAYYPEKHSIEISLDNALQLCVTRFIHEGTSPNQTFAMLIAHELGHAHPDSHYLYTERFINTIDEINALAHEIYNKWDGVMTNRLDKEDVERLQKELEDIVFLRNEYSKMELQGERDAFQHGRAFVPENLVGIFEMVSLEDYLAYSERNKWHINKYKNDLYIISNRLEGYQKLDYNSSWLTELIN